MAIGTISALLAATQLGAGLYGMSKRMKDRSGQERIRQLLAQAKAGNLRDAQAIAGSGTGINPALAQRAALDAVTEANAEAERSAMNQEAAMAERDRARTDRLTGGVLGALGTFGSQLLAARDTSDDKGELDPIIAAKMREASLRGESVGSEAPARTRQEVDPTAPAAPEPAASGAAEPADGDSMNLEGLGEEVQGRGGTLMDRFLRGELSAEEMKAMGQQIDADVEAAAINDAIMDEDIAGGFTEDEGLFPAPTDSERMRQGLSTDFLLDEYGGGIGYGADRDPDEAKAGREARAAELDAGIESIAGLSRVEALGEKRRRGGGGGGGGSVRRRRDASGDPDTDGPTSDEAAVASAEALLEWQEQRAQQDAAARRTHEERLNALRARPPSGSLDDVRRQLERRRIAAERLEEEELRRQRRHRQETESELQRRTSEMGSVSSAAPTEQPITSQIPGWPAFERREGAQRSQAALAALQRDPDAFLSAANNDYGLQVGSQLVTALKARNMGVLDSDGWVA